MYRRIILVSMLTLLSTGSRRAATGLGVSQIFLSLYNTLHPFRLDSTNIFAIVMSYEIMFTYFLCLLLDADVLAGLESNFIGTTDRRHAYPRTAARATPPAPTLFPLRYLASHLVLHHTHSR